MGLFKRTAVITLAVAGLALTGCSGEQPKPVAAPAPVSTQTSCDLLFQEHGATERLWSRATSLVVDASTGEDVDASEVKDVTTLLGNVEATSGPDLRTWVAQMRTTVSDLDNLDASDYRTAATEVSNVCAPYEAL